MDKATKLQEHITKRDNYKAKLKEMYKHFRGVKHENSLSELQDSTIKVYEDMVRSLNAEIEMLKKN
ncbi:MAG: hypothetical protein ACD_19C00182G0063 [uncultured bacterium]|nr:MAG: hypothetical protein ACD_19C00182G0063 [uncultured bacterium]